MFLTCFIVGIEGYNDNTVNINKFAKKKKERKSTILIFLVLDLAVSGVVPSF